MWNGSYFQIVSLRALGLRYQLGHGVCELCPFPQPGHKDFVVVAENGIHEIALDFCGCPTGQERFVQILESGWWPSTPKDPQSAFTNSCLRTFHILNLQGRLPPTDYYRGLEQMSNGNGMNSCPVCLTILSNAVSHNVVGRNAWPNLWWWFVNGVTQRCVNEPVVDTQ
jgi:hypothetical protein